MNAGLYTTPDTAKSRAAEVYLRLREEVMGGLVKPRVRLGEERLAQRYGVSRTPVREALARLATDGLIERRDNGFYVTTPNLAELKDLYELRVTLELRGIARAIEDPATWHDLTIIDAELARWRAFRADPPPADPRFVVHDEQFHVTLSAASGNPALTDALIAVNQKIRRVRMYDFLTAERISETIDEHLEILQAIRDGELERAYDALFAHVGGSLSVVLSRAERALTQLALHSGLS
ncbi:GntR family transcriptional regulator [Amycolatopsis xylanica]|nr:GntR family transcriptional regulator [Amycolatopsis xylanica]